jgi:hypothetical protein
MSADAKRSLRAVTLGVFFLAGLARGASAQLISGEGPPPGADDAAPLPKLLTAGAPAVPIAPATISRDEEGRATVRAVRLNEPLRLDGVLNEAHDANVPAMSDFIQR